MNFDKYNILEFAWILILVGILVTIVNGCATVDIPKDDSCKCECKIYNLTKDK